MGQYCDIKFGISPKPILQGNEFNWFLAVSKMILVEGDVGFIKLVKKKLPPTVYWRQYL